MTRIVLPEEFDEAFRDVFGRRSFEIAACWNNSPEYSNLCLRAENSLFHEVASKLGLEYVWEYWGIDALMYERADQQNFPGEHWAEQLTVVIEHENQIAGAHAEMNKLTVYNSPLKVLVTYPWVRSAPAVLGKYADIVRRADVFSDFTNLRRHLVIFGFGPEEDITWESYVYLLGQFVPLGATS